MAKVPTLAQREAASNLHPFGQLLGRWENSDPELKAYCQQLGFVPHHNADGSLRHYCTADYCPDLCGTEK